MGIASKATRGAAAASIRPVTGVIGFKVLAYVIKTDGSTCDEAEHGLGMRHQTCSARFNELRGKGLITESTTKRKTQSGRYAVVYIPTEAGRAVIADRAVATPPPLMMENVTAAIKRTPVRTPVAS